jgi:NCS1 family nucleobase:cation symporter-1
MFVNWGASVKDVFVGLAIGNVLAVLTWTFLCAPIAVDTRLTLYWYLRRIGGPVVTLIYNVLNAILFCILAGCMITVAASAVRIPFNIPAQTDWYPTDPRFVLVVLVVGAVVVTLAILGFKRLAGFATICSPWLFLMFIGGALVMLPTLSEVAGTGPIKSLNRLWEIGRVAVWTGTTPDGSPPLGFGKIVAFAWICNLAMHGGLSDMALLRYAKRAHYGLFSAFGMFLGHYVAWICAGVMGAGAAALLKTPLNQLDAGEVGFQALGVAGAIAVIIAGWTTSNPTLYRAGLAFQAVTPNWSRVAVTLVTGVVTTIIACFPFVFSKLLDFVGLYGLLLVPAGAIVATEHWIFPRIGLTRYWATYRRVSINEPALVAWVLATAMALGLWFSGILHLFYLFLPVYIVTSLLYIWLASHAGAADIEPDEPAGAPSAAPHASAAPATADPARSLSALGWASGLVALAALIACLVMPLQVFLAGSAGYSTNLDVLRTWLIAPTLVYFVAGTVFYYQWRKTTAA